MNKVHRGTSAPRADQPAAGIPGPLRRFGLPAAALSLALGAAQVAAAAPSQAASSGRVVFQAAPTLPRGAQAAAAPAASKRLDLSLELNTGHAAALQAFASAVNNQSSPYFHDFLKPSQIAQYFGASADQVAAVSAQLRAQGLTVGQLSADGMFLPVSGTVAQTEHAFGVTIAGYRSAGRTFYANTTAPTVTGSIAGDVANVVGLDDVAYAVPHYVVGDKNLVAAPKAALTSKVTPASSTGTCSAIATWGSEVKLQQGAGYYSADYVAKAYGMNSMLASGNDGTGVTVAVFELESYDATGVADLDSCYGHSNSVTEVSVDGGPTGAANQMNNEGVESALDIENIANLAPGASIIDYAGPENATDTNVLDTYAAIFNADKAKVVSTSWGLCEPLSAQNSSTIIASESTLFAQAAAQGQTVVAASGDSGSTDCASRATPGSGTDATILSVDDPASQPFVLGVGGTNMTGTTTFPQTVWNSCQSAGDPTSCGAGGGGVSGQWPLQPFQSGLNPAGYSAHCATATTTGCRMVPDVSALADPANGYVIVEYASGTNVPAGEYFNTVGGTSGAAPVWAAVFAQADSAYVCKHYGSAGFVNLNLYAAGRSGTSGAFNDVKTGNNYISSWSSAGGYSAGTGYDLATGWGSPVSSNVVNAVCQPGSYYVPNGPVRLLDTRSGLGGTTGPLASGATVNLQITGVNSVPTTRVTAVVLNVTALTQTSNGVGVVYPTGSPKPVTSNLNWRAGQAISNLVVVPVGTGGKVSLWNGSAGTMHYIADEEGYFTTSATGASTYRAVNAARVMDTTNGVGVPKAPIAGGTSDSLQVGGAVVAGTGVTIPTGISAVALNVTALNPTRASDLIVYPNETSTGAASSVPKAVNVNFTTGQTIANTVIVPVGPDGKVDFRDGGGSGSLDVYADIEGYFTSGTSGSRFHPVGPARLLDTRSGLGTAQAGAIAQQSLLSIALPKTYTAVVANVTVVSPTAAGSLTAYPSGGTQPTVANIDFASGRAIPNLSIVPSNAGVTFDNGSTGTIQLTVDMAGYFSAH